MLKTIIECDICRTVIEGRRSTSNSQVIMMTEQDEGRAVAPYIEHIHLDLCYICIAKVLAGNAIYGKGAMGYNSYSFTKFW